MFKLLKTLHTVGRWLDAAVPALQEHGVHCLGGAGGRATHTHQGQPN